MDTVQSTVDTLVHAFQEFKSSNDERIKALETKGAADPLLEEKVDRLNAEIDSRYQQLKSMQTASKRPMLSPSTGMSQHEGCEHKSAFMNYIRKGDESKLLNLNTKSLSIASDPDGGFLIPQILSENVRTALETLSPIRKLASVISISSSAIELLHEKEGTEVGWAAETAMRAVTETSKLQKIRIPLHEMYAKPRATQKLLDDSNVNVEQWIVNSVSRKMAQMENQAYLFGNGENKPTGIFHYESVTKDAHEWGKWEHLLSGVDGGINSADVLIDTVNALQSHYHQNAKWLMSRSAQAAVRKLKDQTGQYLWQPGLNGSATPTLLGYEVEIAEDMPTLTAGTQSKSIIFGDFKEAYQIVDRAAIHVLRDPYSAKPYIEFYTTRRTGGDVVNFDALKMISFAE